MPWLYDENWAVENETLIRQTAPNLGAERASVWNARIVSDAACGRLTRQKSRWVHLNELRAEIGQQPIAAPQWKGEEVGTLRVDGLNILNDGTPYGTVGYMVQGYRMFDAFGLYLYGIQDFNQSLDYPLELGFKVIFIATTMYAPNGHPVTLDPRVNVNLYDKLTEVADMTKARGARLWAYACADCGPSNRPSLNMSTAEQHTHWLKHSERLQGGYHVPSVANEGPNGNSADVQGFPIPPNCPVWSRGSGGEFPPKPNGATLAELELKRRNEGEEPFKMTADCASVEYHTLERSGPRLGVPVVQVENTFAANFQQLGRRSNEPRLFQAQAGAATVTREYGCGGYAFGSENSRFGMPLIGREHESAEAAIQIMRAGFTR